MQEILAQFNPGVMKTMLGGGAQEERRKASRGTLDARFSGETPAQDGSYLEFVHMHGQYERLGQAITAGRYAFVRMLDLTIRVWPILNTSDTFHAGLSSFAARIYYAGELEIDDSNRILSWNNRSGQYRPDARLAAQAGLPMSRFVEHRGPM